MDVVTIVSMANRGKKNASEKIAEHCTLNSGLRGRLHSSGSGIFPGTEGPRPASIAEQQEREGGLI